jgi:hypothetical protein
MATLLKPQLKQSAIVTAIAVASRGREEGEGGTAVMYFCGRLSLAAMCANAGNLNQRTAWRKACRARRRFQRLGGGVSRRLADRTAAFANEENHKVAGTVIVHAGNKGVAAFDAVHEAVVAQKFQRAVNRDRCRTCFVLQAVDDFIGAERAMAAQQDFKYVAPHWREPLSARGALRFRMRNRGAGAALMIMIRGGEDRG